MKKNTEPKEIEKLLRRLCGARRFTFPKKGYTESLVPRVPDLQGAYVIYDSYGVVVHVGRTVRGRGGLRQRLNNHLLGQSSFVGKHLRGKGRKLRGKYQFRYIEVKDDRQRALLESLAVGRLCPRHLGLGLLNPK